MQEESTHPEQGTGAHGPHLTAGISTLSWCLRCPVAQHCAAQTTPGKEPTLIISIPKWTDNLAKYSKINH